MAKSTKAFNTAFAKLNTAQKQAVQTIDGPVMVVAGPGSGKTQTIALRIANILNKTDTDPGAILALTFTESGAKAMRERLREFIGHDAYYINISTFHSFCTDVIREHPDHFTINPSSEPLSDLAKLKLIQRLLDQGKWDHIRPINAPNLYTKAIISSIQDLKREGISPREFKEILNHEHEYLNSAVSDGLSKTAKNERLKSLNKNQELLKIYAEYQTHLSSTNNFDFEDMINFVSDEFSNNSEILSIYQERFHYFLIDEFQDTNSAQNEVVNLLSGYWGDQANIFVVGDPDQAIYRFQGASIENILSFNKRYPNAKIISLSKNYRSTQTILDAASSVIENNHLRISDVIGESPSLKSTSVNKFSKIQLANLPTHMGEAIYVANHISRLIKSGVPASEIAVIYRNNSDAKDLIEALIKSKIDYITQGGGNILEDPVVQRLIKIFRVIRDIRIKQDDLDLFTILHYDIFEIDALDVLKISRHAAENRSTLFDVIADSNQITSLNLSTPSKIQKVLDQISHWQSIDANSTFIEFFERVLNESGYLNWLLKQPDSYNKINKLNTLFNEVKKMNLQDHDLNLEKFLKDLDLIEINNLRIQEVGLAPRKDAVTLTTAHSAKGLEWQSVFIYKAYDGHWGNNRTRQLIKLPPSILTNTDLSKKEKNEDERRLFYVALTRAKQELIISHAEEYESYGKSKQVIPSMFVEEIKKELIKPTDPIAKTQKSKSSELELILASQERPTTNSKEKVFLSKLVEKFTLSATSLNTYLECPYKFKLNNLLKVPRAKASYLAFGTAVHSALEKFLREYNEYSKRPPKDFLLQTFKQSLQKEILTKEEYSARLEQGNKILSAYYDFHQDDFRNSLFLEKFSRVQMDDITLTGKIDQITWDDEADRTIKVIDFKTGKTKTKGQIMGTTQDSTGSLHRQLVFYKLLIDLDRRLQVNFGKAELDFIQSPYEKNKSGKYSFSISDQDLSELKKTIKEVMYSIKKLAFPRINDYSICARCEFIDHCYPEGIPSQSKNR